MFDSGDSGGGEPAWASEPSPNPNPTPAPSSPGAEDVPGWAMEGQEEYSAPAPSGGEVETTRVDVARPSTHSNGVPSWMRSSAPAPAAAKPQRAAWVPSWQRGADNDEELDRPLLGYDGADAQPEPFCGCLYARHVLAPVLALAALASLATAVAATIQRCPSTRIETHFLAKAVTLYSESAIAFALTLMSCGRRSPPVALAIVAALAFALANTVLSMIDTVAVVQHHGDCDDAKLPLYWLPLSDIISAVPWLLAVRLLFRLNSEQVH